MPEASSLATNQAKDKLGVYALAGQSISAPPARYNQGVPTLAPHGERSTMPADFKHLLWFLKLGALLNLYLIGSLWVLPKVHPQVLIPGLILLGVSAFRCLFPNRYLDNVVFHDTPLSSIFLTRVLATFSEVAYIYQFAYLIRILNFEHIPWVDGLSWLMVVQVLISQGFVWAAILLKRLDLYFYEEVGWFIIFAANSAASAFLYATTSPSATGAGLLQLNLLFGAGYLPWQILHLRSLRGEAHSETGAQGSTTWREGLAHALRQRRPRTDAKSWGGGIGLTWMVAYWASLIPLWVHYIAVSIARV